MAEKAGVYDRVTQQIIDALGRGVVAWDCGWRVHRNVVSGREYRGFNQLLLSLTEYEQPLWITYRAAKEHGGYVRKGEKGTQVVFWSFPTREQILAAEAEGRPEPRPYAGSYTLFNVAQCDGLDLSQFPAATAEAEGAAEDYLEVERVVGRYFLKYRVGYAERGSRAFYRPSAHFVRMPPRGQFTSVQYFASTLVHEAVHSTGHPDLLSRFRRDSRPSDEKYSVEELVAELGAAMLLAALGLSTERTEERSASYIAGWLSVLKDDRRAVVFAAQRAAKAVDLIRGRVGLTPEEKDGTEEVPQNAA